MTREKAIELLSSGKDGLEKWNKWRKKNQPLPDLSDAKLVNCDLSWANLRGLRLRNAILMRSNLSAANLAGADLSGAELMYVHFEIPDLVDADFSGASLTLTNFLGANLSGANLRDARFLGALFEDCVLDGANFSGATCGRAKFSNVDLSVAKGLETVRHEGPSSIGIDTIFNSRGKIPDAFLRGCGVPDEFIRYIPSLIGSMLPVQFYSCFISYSQKDEEFCKRLHSRLQQERLRVWFAPEDIRAGRRIIDEIDIAIGLHDKLLLVLSEHSMKSDWVATEIYKARQREKRENKRVLFPIRLCEFDTVKEWRSFDGDSGKDMAREIREYHIPDFSNWKNQDDFEKAFARLLKDLRATETGPLPSAGHTS